jgi:hypothetical protein
MPLSADGVANDDSWLRSQLYYKHQLAIVGPELASAGSRRIPGSPDRDLTCPVPHPSGHSCERPETRRGHIQ